MNGEWSIDPLRRAIHVAIAETVQEFLQNPWQFHGDTGIMQYLYPEFPR